jgi:transcriptional regulator with XRE-family HTH domain
MNNLGKRIQELRKKQDMSQTELADNVSVSKSQIIRYETKGAQPPADILNKMADVLHTSVDYLINGATEEKAKAALKNNDLLVKFKEIESMPDKEQVSILNVISAYIRDFKTRQAYAQ